MTDQSSSMVFDVTGMDCGDCARSVERVVSRLPGVEQATVSFGAGTLTVEPSSQGQSAGVDLGRAIGSAVDRAGYTAVLRAEGIAGRPARQVWWRNRKLIPAGIATVLWIAAFLIDQLTAHALVPVVLYALTILVGGYPIARSALTSILARRIDMNVLMTISVAGAALIGEWSEGGLVVVLFAIGTTLQALTLDRTRNAIRSLLDLTPEQATVVRSGVELTLGVDALQIGDLVRVRPGERLPADGEVVEGHSAIDQSAITGESLPVDKGADDPVFTGTINGSGVLLIRVTRRTGQSMLANIVHLVEEAQASKAPSQQLVDRFAAVYTPAVVIVAALLALGGFALSSDSGTWVYRALVLLVIACPCALVISTPVSIVSAIGAATRRGMLIKGGAALEEAGRAKIIAFDKTGTLTLGRPSVTRIEPVGDRAAADVLAAAAAVEQFSEHPLARAIVAKALHDRVPLAGADAFTALPGRGARAVLDGRTIAVGSDRLMAETGLSPEHLEHVRQTALANAENGQSTLSVASIDGDGSVELLGTIAVADRVRPGVRESLQRLRDQGVERVVMLTGDREPVARSVAATVGVDEVYADLLPDEKAAAIAGIQQRYGTVAMVGDGVNDAPALATANVGIAMGIAGTDIALESADLALMRDDLTALERLLDLSRSTLRVVRQNVALSLITKALALLLGTLGFVNLWIAVLADVGTSVVVTLNGLRLARAERAAADSPPEVGGESCSCDETHAHAHAD